MVLIINKVSLYLIDKYLVSTIQINDSLNN